MTAGIGVSIPPTYINEILPEEVRGTLGSLVQFQVTFGIFVSNLVCLPLPTYNFKSPDNQLWMLAYGFPVIPAAIKLVILTFVYDFDTPAWLQRSQRPNEHERALKAIYGTAWEDFSQKAQNNEKKQADPSFKEIFASRRFRNPLIVGCMLATIQQLVGINAFIFYSGVIFSGISGSKNFSNFFTAALNFVNMTSTMLSLLCVEKKGRKFMMIQGCIGMAVCHALAFIFSIFSVSNEAIIVFVFVYIVFFETSSGPVLWIYCGETLTDRGIGIAVAFNWFFSAVIGAVVPVLIEAVGIEYLFLGFGVSCSLSTVYCWFFMKETRGKTQVEIANMFEEN
jgi:hypothetical protein